MDRKRRAARRRLGRNFETVAWGLALLAFGSALLVPGDQADIVLACLGSVLLALNLARAVAGLNVSWFTIVLGATALAVGIGSALGGSISLAGTLLAIVGAMLVLRAGGNAVVTSVGWRRHG